jgi:hypothetical protein
MSILSRLASLLREEAAYWRDPDRAEKNRDADKFRGMSEDEYDTYLETEYCLDQERAAIRERERS